MKGRWFNKIRDLFNKKRTFLFNLLLDRAVTAIKHSTFLLWIIQCLNFNIKIISSHYKWTHITWPPYNDMKQKDVYPGLVDFLLPVCMWLFFFKAIIDFTYFLYLCFTLYNIYISAWQQLISSIIEEAFLY